MIKNIILPVKDDMISQNTELSCSSPQNIINSTNYTYGSLELGSASNGSANTYYTRDNNGRSVSVLTDSTGVVKNTYAYDPWGNSLGKTEAVSNPWQFASGYLDATTGLYKFGTRYYSPTLGRWTQQDLVGGSVGKVGSGNAYVYADDAPVMTTDPSGESPGWCATAIVATLGAILPAYIALQVCFMGFLGALIGTLIEGSPFLLAVIASALGPVGIIILALIGSLVFLGGFIASSAFALQPCFS